jgi:hypothetical protein
LLRFLKKRNIGMGGGGKVLTCSAQHLLTLPSATAPSVMCAFRMPCFLFVLQLSVLFSGLCPHPPHTHAHTQKTHITVRINTDRCHYSHTVTTAHHHYHHCHHCHHSPPLAPLSPLLQQITVITITPMQQQHIRNTSINKHFYTSALQHINTSTHKHLSTSAST